MERRSLLRSLAITGGLLGTAGIIKSCKSATASTTDESFDEDAALVKAGAEFEAMGIKTYEVAAASGLIETQAVLDTAVAYMTDHVNHLEALNSLLKSFEYDEVDPSGAQPAAGVANVTNETDVIKLALSVEFDAATFYFSGIVNEVKSPDARRVFANILPVETAHFVTYKNVLGFNPAIDGSLFADLSSGL
jgi:rubrerythrin